MAYGLSQAIGGYLPWPRRFLIFFACAATVAFLSDVLISEPGIGYWKPSHFVVNYETEFSKRGIIGQAFQLLQVEPSIGNATAFSYGLVAVLVVLFWYLGTRCIGTDGREWPVYVSFLLFSPAGFLQFGVDLGRFDQIHIVILIATVLLLRTSYQALVPLLCVLGTLAHESFVVTTAPVIVVILCHHALVVGNRITWAALAALSTGVTFAAVLMFGQVNGATLVQMQSELVSMGVPAKMASETTRIWQWSVQDNIETTLRYYFKKPHILAWNMASVSLVLAYMAVWTRNMSVPDNLSGRVKTRFRVLLLTVAATPLLLLPAGLDAARWAAIMCVNQLVVMCYLVLICNRGTVLAGSVRRLAGLNVVSAIAGPLGINVLFPVWIDAVKLIGSI
jgi:hypothetical protein